jgi:alpha-tubulin suppressor-like RCC1 family protein
VNQSLIQISLLSAVLLHALTTGAQPVIKIAAGCSGYHTLFLKSDGSLWGMGLNNYGQLGDGTLNDTNLPEQIMPSNVIAIATCSYDSVLLKNDGSLWDMGYNSYGDLGDGTGDSTNQPEQIVASNVTAVAIGTGPYTGLDFGALGYGGEHTYCLFLEIDGSLWGFGTNTFGELGTGNSISTNRPEMILATNVIAIAAGGWNSLFIKKDGSAWGMGRTISFPSYMPVKILASNVTAIAAGWFHNLFLMSNGSMWAMGYNTYGQLGDGTYNTTNQPEMIVASNVVAIAAGGDHSLFLKSDGSLWAMGFNRFGQLGDGTSGPTVQTNLPEEIVASGIIAIAAGADHSLFLKSDGSLWGMGHNYYGQLGDGTSGIGNFTNWPEQIVGPYNQISGQLLTNGDMQLSFVGIAVANYALDWATSLSPANWLPVATNLATSYGALVFTNTPDPTTNNFWRIRLMP